MTKMKKVNGTLSVALWIVFGTLIVLACTGCGLLEHFVDVDGTARIKLGEDLDATVPSVLTAISGWVPGILGVALGTLGGLWKSRRIGRVLVNTIASVQSVRDEYKKNGSSALLKTMDALLTEAQDASTIKTIAKIKSKIAE